MGSFTPNLNLYKPDSSDDYENFREEFNDNMDKIDQSGGGGGSTVSWNQILQSGTKIAEITINGTTQDVFAPSGGKGGIEKTYSMIGLSRSKIKESFSYEVN